MTNKRIELTKKQLNDVRAMSGEKFAELLRGIDVARERLSGDSRSLSTLLDVEQTVKAARLTIGCAS